MPQSREIPVADAPKGNWVDLYAPEAARPYLRLSRADRPIGTWLLLIPCFWGIALAAMMDGYRAWDLWLAVSCGFGAFVMRGAGCTSNDITDRDIDARVARTRSRPLPSGAVTTKQALAPMVVQALIGAGVLVCTTTGCRRASGVASLALARIYPFAKRFTWWPQVFPASPSTGARFYLCRPCREPEPRARPALRGGDRLDALLRHDLCPP